VLAIDNRGDETVAVDKAQLERARELRRRLTPAEALLWRRLRGRQLGRSKFRRQHPVGPYFADFLCPACRVVVETDGESHLGDARRDRKRDEFLRSEGFVVLRFWNTQVFDETDAVLEAIYAACAARELK
jgi:adenine-specific DNA-methyltransferase